MSVPPNLSAMVASRALGSGSSAAAPEIAQAVLEALPLQIAIVDAAGVICHVNERWRIQAGFQVGDNYIRKCEEKYGGAAGGALPGGLRAVLDGRQDHLDVQYCSPNAERFRITAVPFAANGLVGAVVTRERLAAATAESEHASTEAEAGQAQRMQVIGRMVGGVVHDFANLLTLISGYSDILLNRMTADDPFRGELEEIIKAATRGSRLTAQLLGFTRGQAVQPEILDLNGLIVAMEKMLRPIIGEHIGLATALTPALGGVYADAGHMEQVIMNLVLNARDAMPRGGRILIETSNLEVDESGARAFGLAPGAYVLLSVSDTGEGIDGETMDHLFEPFFTTKQRGKGTGLGLSTVYNIVQQWRGYVWVRSELSKGSTFSVCFPAAAENRAASGEHAHAPVAGTETILLVEDEDSVRRLLKHVLVRQGYTVLEAPDGPRALAILENHSGPIHLLLTDMIMPGMNGRELAERTLPLRPDLKVIYISGYTDDILRHSGALGPGMSFLQKPLKPDVLAAKVRAVLDAGR